MTTKITVESIREWAAQNNLLPTPGPARTGSNEVSFSLALQWISPFLEACPTSPPPAFSPQWQDEADEQIKFIAILLAAVQWALQAEIRQGAMVEASSAVAEGVAATSPTPASSARYLAADAAQPPFDYPPRRAA